MKTHRSFIPIFLSLLTFMLSHSVAAAELRVNPEASRVAFTVQGNLGSLAGRFSRYQGDLEFAKGSLVPQQVNFTIDLSKLTLENQEPSTSILAEQLVMSLPDTVVRFKTKEIKRIGPAKLVLIGEALWSGRKERVAIPVDILENSAKRTVVRGAITGRPEFGGPTGLLFGNANGTVNFTLAFDTKA